jgi:hypothetical protein
MENKKIWTSKTIWVNVIAMVALIIPSLTSTPIDLGPEVQVGLLGLINLILRLVTKSEIVWK